MHLFTQKPVNKHEKGKKKKDVEEMQHEIFTSNLKFLTKGHLIVQGLLDKTAIHGCHSMLCASVLCSGQTVEMCCVANCFQYQYMYIQGLS